MSTSDECISLGIFLGTFLAMVNANRWDKVSQKMFFWKKIAKVEELKKLEVEAEQLNHPSTMTQHFKVCRTKNASDKELASLESDYRSRWWFYFFIPRLISWITRCGFVLPCYMLWGDRELVVVPDYFAGGYVTLALRGKTLWELMVNCCNVPLFAAQQLCHALFLSYCPVSVVWRGYSTRDDAFGYQEQWMRSFGVLSWSVLCFLFWSAMIS